jgi:uncharacterized membrane protein
MSEKGKYRIIEKDVFYIQKRKRFGWGYIHEENHDKEVSYIIIGFAIGLIIMSIIFNQYVWLYISIFLIGLGVKGLIPDKKDFSTLQNAEIDVERQIESEKQKIINKEKKKNSKIHYLDKKAERLDKLRKINR